MLHLKSDFLGLHWETFCLTKIIVDIFLAAQLQNKEWNKIKNPCFQCHRDAGEQQTSMVSLTGDKNKMNKPKLGSTFYFEGDRKSLRGPRRQILNDALILHSEFSGWWLMQQQTSQTNNCASLLWVMNPLLSNVYLDRDNKTVLCVWGFRRFSYWYKKDFLYHSSDVLTWLTASWT